MTSTQLAPPRRRRTAGFTQDVLERIADKLGEIMEDVEAAGVEPDSLGTPDELARRMIATIPQPSPWAKVVGPVYTTQGLRALFGGVTRQAIDDRISRGTLFALATADNRRVFPAFQFDDHNSQLEGLAEILRQLLPVADGWTVASWFTHPADALRGRTPIEWLRDGNEQAPLDALVRATAARWAR